MSEPILHLTSRTDWQIAQIAGEYRAPSLASEGFIHCSTALQIERVANAFYAGRRGLVVLVIDPARLRAALKWEPPAHPASAASAPASDERFPHIHGPLNLNAVVRVIDWEPDASGQFLLPESLVTGNW